MKGTGYSYSKISLSLAITGKRDEMHELDMIVVPYKKYMDSVSFSPNPAAVSLQDITVTTTRIHVDTDRFISFISPKLSSICEYFGIYGSFQINKGVPLGAGIGGSACPIAAAIKAVESACRLMGRGKTMEYSDMAKLGSDVPCVYFGNPCRVTGTGESIEPISNEKYYYVDYLFNSGVDTKKAYEYFDLHHKENAGCLPSSISEAIASKRNDLEESAVIMNPKIGALLNLLRSEGKTAIVSGCGSAVFEISTVKI